MSLFLLENASQLLLERGDNLVLEDHEEAPAVTPAIPPIFVQIGTLKTGSYNL